MIKMTPGIYNRNPALKGKPLPHFSVTIGGTSSGQIDLRRFLKIYKDAIPYRKFLFNIKGRTLLELLSNHRRNNYCMYEMIDSGAVDNFGCFYPNVMAELRPSIESVASRRSSAPSVHISIVKPWCV